MHRSRQDVRRLQARQVQARLCHKGAWWGAQEGGMTEMASGTVFLIMKMLACSTADFGIGCITTTVAGDDRKSGERGSRVSGRGCSGQGCRVEGTWAQGVAVKAVVAVTMVVVVGRRPLSSGVVGGS